MGRMYNSTGTHSQISGSLWVKVPRTSMDAAITDPLSNSPVLLPIFEFGVSADPRPHIDTGIVTLQGGVTEGQGHGEIGITAIWQSLDADNFIQGHYEHVEAQSDPFENGLHPGGIAYICNQGGLGFTAVMIYNDDGSIAGGPISLSLPGDFHQVSFEAFDFNEGFGIGAEQQVQVSIEHQTKILGPSGLAVNSSGDVTFLAAGPEPAEYFIAQETTKYLGSGFVFGAWNHIFFAVDSSTLQWGIIVNGADTHSSPPSFSHKFEMPGGEFGFPIIGDDIGRHFYFAPNKLIRYAFVQIWVDQYIEPAPNMQHVFTSDRRPVKVFPATKTIGLPTIACRKGGDTFFKNIGSGESFTRLGTLRDFKPGPQTGTAGVP